MEASLLHSIRHATVGGRLANEVGRGLDGSEENLSEYSGKTTLVDFWATWCGPCIASLPDLRELASAYPKDRFEVLSISVDDDVEDVIEFMDAEPMPWSHWHVDIDGELIKSWQVRAFPTYVVVDENGVIFARNSSLNETSKLIEELLGPPKGEEDEAES